MQITWFLVVGLVGVTLVVSKGKVFDGLRYWLMRFEHESNPFRIAGEVMSCSMCCGVWIGALGALAFNGSWAEAILVGGVVSIVAWPLGEALQVFEGALERRRGAPEGRMMAMLQARAQERQKRRHELGGGQPSSDMSEDDAHRWLDAQDRLDEEVLSDPSLTDEYESSQRQEKEEQVA